MVPWQSGYARVCNTLYMSSILIGTSNLSPFQKRGFVLQILFFININLLKIC